MAKLIRFREYKEYTLDAFFAGTIAGTKFSRMDDKKEALLSVDDSKLSTRFNIGDDIFLATKDIVRNHILDSYYLASFTTEDHIRNPKMWMEYAGKDGFLPRL